MLSRDAREAGGDLAVLAVVWSGITWALFIILSAVRPGSNHLPRIPDALLSLAILALAVGAGVMSAVQARICGERRPLLASLGLVLYGLFPVGITQALLPFVRQSTYGLGLFGDLSSSLILALILAGLVSDFHPEPLWNWRIRALIPLVAVVVALVVAIVDRGVLWGGRPAWSAHWVVANCLAAATWAVVGFLVVRQGSYAQSANLVWSGMAMIVFGEARVAFLFSAANWIWEIAGDLLRGLGMLIAFLAMARSADRAINEHRGYLQETIDLIEGAELTRAAERRRQEEVAHDLISALASVGSASRVLALEEVAINTDHRETIASAIEAELQRVRELLRSGPRADRQPFFLRDLLRPLVVLARAEGVPAEMDIPADIIAYGHPPAIAEIVRTLLDNAHRHAPGSAVELSARRGGGVVSISVEDRGPGIEPGTEELIFQRGWTSHPAEEGRGLGLYVAARLAGEQQGRVTVGRRRGGGARFTVEIPAAQAGDRSLLRFSVAHPRNHQS